MGDVSNKSRVIAHRGSKHKAKTKGMDDMLHPEGKPAEAKPYENHIYTAGFLEISTNSQNTFIKSCRIWIDEGRVGQIDGIDSLLPNANDHIGLESKVFYRKEAWNTSCSDNLFVESKGVVRTDDTTKQNKANCDGVVDGSELDLTGELTEDYFKNACKIVKLTGQSSEKKPAKLGKKSDKATKDDYLHVFEGDTVDLEAERMDTTGKQPKKAGTCQLEPKHTIWKVKRTGGDQKPKEKEGSGDKLTIPEDLTQLGSATNVGASASVESKGASVSVDWDAMVKAWRCEKNPGEIEVKAIACGGAQTANLVVKPAGPIKFELAFEDEPADRSGKNEKKLGNCNSYVKLFLLLVQLKKGLKLLKAIADIGSANLKWEYKFLAGCSIELELEYKRCEKSGNHRGAVFTPAYIRPAWKVTLAFKPLIYLKLAGNIALVDLLQVLPGVGTAAVGLLKAIKVTLAHVELRVELQCNLGTSIGQDQHNELQASYLEAEFILTFTLELLVGQEDIASASAAAFIEGKLSIGVGPPKKAGSLLTVGFKGGVTTGITLSGKVWGLKAEKTFDGPELKPEPGEKHIPEPN